MSSIRLTRKGGPVRRPAAHTHAPTETSRPRPAAVAHGMHDRWGQRGQVSPQRRPRITPYSGASVSHQTTYQPTRNPPWLKQSIDLGTP
eukprot:341765-Prymnesium_polylepis.1